jgi:hypothetical protein
LVFSDDDPQAAIAAAAANGDETKLLVPEMFYRLVVTRDANGAFHFFVNGVYSHSHHNGDAIDGIQHLKFNVSI